MKKGCRPEFSWKTEAVEKSAGLNSELVVVDFNSTILRGAIHASWLKCVVEIPQKHLLEIQAPSQFTTLVRPDASTILMTMLGEKLLNDVNGGGLRVGQKHPNKTRSFVNNQQVQGVNVVGKHDPILSFVPSCVVQC
jgi:hypothetical protein